MKSTLSALFLSLLISSNVFAVGLKLTPGTYKIDPAHTRVSFLIKHFVVSEVQGRFNDVEGTFMLSDNIGKSTIDVTIPINSIDTAVAKRDEHLKSPDFFDAAKYPTMTFKSKKFTGSLSSFRVTGDLTIKDVTKEVVLVGKYTGSAKDPWGGTRAAVSANTKINRKDFHINYNDKIDIGPAVGDEVTIQILSEGVLEK